MIYEKLFLTIDSHTGGNPTRTLLSGLPKLDGETMADKMLFMQENYDWIREFLMNEPRGHDVMSGAFITEPVHENADIGVIYVETGGYLPMCGHDTIGLCTALVEMGMVEVVEPYTLINIDTPAGLVETVVQVIDGKAKKVSFHNVPAFLLKSVVVDVPSIGEVYCDISYGGNFYGIISADSIGLQLETENSATIIEKAITIRNYINANIEVVHPEFPFINGLTHIEFYTAPINPQADVKNAVVVPPGGIDRSPCGTGTSAKLATLYEKNELEINDLFIHESIVGSLFEGEVISEVKVKDKDAVITKITGTAWIMGMHKFFYNEQDELKRGYLMIPPMNGGLSNEI